ncbi:sugar-binding transcriptional regulator [Polymorphum gilvum]|uniref:Putative ery operon repressor transcription regulator protein n=1 Tax=Polymorphum gilvum (strain LMG 25793 / CGMCC 1.9160 / SL003B-26A1) TaxID=991905 RepID=F2J2U0_POLGS|nr:sugar-binding transcriptional regulator [Polymorphum gilvum]ADZ72114.1 Putative ery operon repressor transcription regulator protein [Polymorphum gilvum SL003B-26A1]
MARVQDEDWTTYLSVRAAWLSFVGGCTQGEIASRLGVSPAKVHRLIAHAQKEGLVRFQIEGRPIECLKLEDEFARLFGLSTCIIAPDLGGGDQDTAIRGVAAAAGNFLSNVLSSPDVTRVGVGMGRTLKASVEAMPRMMRPDLAIMSISGSLMRKLSANPYDVVQRMLERTGGEGYYLPVPYFAENLEERDMFLGQRSVQDLLERARQSDVFVVGIGSINDEGHLVQRGLIKKAEQEELKRAGAVSDLMGKFLTIDGSIAPVPLGDCAVGLHFEEVRGARVIALVGGEGKAEATLAALRTGVITDLIADETLARALRGMVGSQLAESA